MTTKAQLNMARQLLDELKQHDVQTTRSYYEMGRIMSALRRDALYDCLGYDSMRELIEEELSFTPGTASVYMRLYERFKELKYPKAEVLEILSKHSMSATLRWLRVAKQRVTLQTANRQIRTVAATQREICFWLPSEDYHNTMDVLQEFGAYQEPGTGRWIGTSAAFIDLVRSAQGTRTRKAA